MANEKQISFNIGASLAPSFKQSFGKANEALGVLEKSSNRFKLQQKQMSEEMARLYKNIDASPEKIKKLDEAMKKNREEVVKSRERLIQLRQQMRNGDPENKLGTEYSSLRTKLVGVNKQYKNNELQKNKISTTTIEERKRVSLLINDYNELGKTISKTDKIKNQYARAAKMSSVGGEMKTAGNKMMMAGGIGAGLLTPIMSQTIQAESAFADVKKQFDFVNAEEEKLFKTELNKLIKEKKMAISLPDLYAATASAGQSGLNKDTAIPYVEQSIKMSIAFDMAREEAADSMFQMKKAFNLPLEDLKTLIDQINYLSNTTGATAPQTTAFLLEVGNIAATANLSAASVSALGATLIEQGIKTDKAATGVKNLILTMTGGVAATNRQEEAFVKLGLSATQVSKSMQKDAEGTFKKVFERIQKLKPEEKTSVLMQLFGKESIASAAGTMANLEKYMENLGKVRDKALYGGSAEKEYQTRAQTTQNNIQATIGRTQILATEIGNNLLPLLNQFLDKINNISSKISDFAEKNPEKFKELVEIIGVGIPLLIAFGGALNIAGNIVIVAGAIAKLIPIIASLNLAMLANPAVLVAAGIATLVAATYALIKNWDTVSNWLDKKREGIKNAFVGGQNRNIALGQGESTQTGIGYGGTRKFARGGIVTSPTMGLVGEAGYPEAIIPLDGSSRANSLFETTGRILGKTGSSSNSSNISYNPVFNVTVNGGDAREITQTLRGYENESFDNFKRNLESHEREMKRRRK